MTREDCGSRMKDRIDPDADARASTVIGVLITLDEWNFLLNNK
jgi:hypothetical protein